MPYADVGHPAVLFICPDDKIIVHGLILFEVPLCGSQHFSFSKTL